MWSWNSTRRPQLCESWIHWGMWFKRVWFKLEKMEAVNSSTNQLDNLVMNFPQKMAPRLAFFMFKAPKKETTRRKSRKTYQTPERKRQIPNKIFGFEPLSSTSTPSEIPFSPSDHQPWSPPWKEHQPLNPCSPWQRVESQCYRWWVRFCWSETAGGNVGRWRLWASSWPPKKGRC